MHEQFLRTQMLLGTEALERLQAARVAVFGIGGVGGYTVEALARSGVGQLDLIDNDTVSVSNINRQILATHSTVGMPKVEAAKKRILDINPDCIIRTHQVFYTPGTADRFDFSQYDYIVDAIDTVTGKLALVERAAAAEVRSSVLLTSSPSLTTIPKETPTACSRVPSARYFSKSVLLYALTSQEMLPSASLKRRKASFSPLSPGQVLGYSSPRRLVTRRRFSTP